MRRITENNGNFFGVPIGSDLPTVVSVGMALPSRSDPEGREESPFRPDSEGEGELSMFGIFSDIV